MVVRNIGALIEQLLTARRRDTREHLSVVGGCGG
jgi:hypothetical protein